MFLSAKTKGYFVDCTEESLLLARTSASAPPFVVEAIQECPLGDADVIAGALKVLQPKKSGNYLQAVCGVYTPRRVIRRVTFDLKRIKEAGYLNEVASQQLRVEPDHNTLIVLNSQDGTEYDMAAGTQKEAVICGLPTEEIVALQDQLLAMGVYPDRLEIGSLATIGALVDYLAFTKVKVPTLILEISADQTQSFIVSAAGLETSRPIQQGLDAMIPVVQKELGLKDEESARKLFFSNTFDFTGLAPALIRRLVKELQSSIGFYEVQTGQSIGHVICPLLSPKLAWIEDAIASQLSVTVLKPELAPWLQSRHITFADTVPAAQDARRLGLFGLMAQYTAHGPAPEKA